MPEKKDHSQIARDLFMQGYSCSQAVLLAFRDVTGLDERTSLLVASGLGGGMGRLREVCGTCTAMFIVLGMTEGYTGANEREKKSALYGHIQELARRFAALHGSYICREILTKRQAGEGYVPSERTPEYYKQRPCAICVESAARILDDYFAEKE